MFEIGTALCTNLFRTYVIKRFMTIFFEKKEERKSIEIGVYCVFFLLTSWVHVTFSSLMGNMVLNLLLLYVITQFYKGGQKKKVLIAKSLCEQAHLYVWDEPLNFIDVYSRIQIQHLIEEFLPTLIFVEHDKAFREGIATKSVDVQRCQ